MHGCPRSSDGRTVAVMCAIDNLNKGAAGGAVQWMNRLYGLPETAGLTAPGAWLDLTMYCPLIEYLHERSTSSAPASVPAGVPDFLAPVFSQYPLPVVSAEGVWLHTRGGGRVLDLYGGHAVAVLGYGHPLWTRALSEQARSLSFQSNAVPMDVRARAARA